MKWTNEGPTPVVLVQFALREAASYRKHLRGALDLEHHPMGGDRAAQSVGWNAGYAFLALDRLYDPGGVPFKGALKGG